MKSAESGAASSENGGNGSSDCEDGVAIETEKLGAGGEEGGRS